MNCFRFFDLGHSQKRKNKLDLSYKIILAVNRVKGPNQESCTGSIIALDKKRVINFDEIG